MNETSQNLTSLSSTEEIFMNGDISARSHQRRFRIMAITIVALVIWAGIARIDQVTRAQAQVIAEDRTQLVQSPDGGVITQIHVKEGDAVKAEQVLITLQRDRAEAAVADTSAKVAALRITLARLQAEVYGKPMLFSSELSHYSEYVRNQTELYNKRQTAFHDDLNALKHMLSLAEEELSMNYQLEIDGDVSKAEVLRLQRNVADIKAQMINKKNKYFQDAQTEMTKAQEELNTQLEQLKDRHQLLEHTELLAPMDAIVNNIKVNTLGGVVRAGDTIIELLPATHNLIIEAKIPSSDIAFIAIDQDVNIKVDAYDSTIYGALKGKVKYISSDVLTEDTRQGPFYYYRVKVKLLDTKSPEDMNREIKLRPGLSASVEIKAKDRTVLSYILKPIIKTLSYSMGEK